MSSCPQPFSGLSEVVFYPLPWEFIPSKPMNQPPVRLEHLLVHTLPASYWQLYSLPLSPSINLMFLKHLHPTTPFW